MHPAFGVEPVLLDAQGQEVHGNDVHGLLAIRNPTPGMARTVHGDHERFLDTYWRPLPGYYFTGDGAHRDAEGHYRITGKRKSVAAVAAVLVSGSRPVFLWPQGVWMM
jgi:acetyl-CoA synthetase